MSVELEELCDEYVQTNPEIQSKETVRLLRLSVRHFGQFLDDKPLAAHLVDRNLVAYMQHRRALGRAETTIERETAKLFTLARYAARNGHAPDPRFRPKKARVDIPVAFMRHEVRALFRVANRYKRTIAGVPGDIFMVALLLVCWDTAERIGAVIKIERGDIDLRGRWVTSRERKRNGKPLIRRVRRRTAKALASLMDAHDGPRPFGLLKRESLYYHLNRLLVDAGLPVDRKHKFHCLRRSHASWLHRAGGDSRDSLDHESDQTTRTYYHDPRVTRRWSPIDYLFDPMSPWGRLLARFGL